MPPCFPLPAEFFVWSLHPLLESLCIFALLHSLRFVHETGCSLSSFAPSRRRARDAFIPRPHGTISVLLLHRRCRSKQAGRSMDAPWIQHDEQILKSTQTELAMSREKQITDARFSTTVSFVPRINLPLARS